MPAAHPKPGLPMLSVRHLYARALPAEAGVRFGEDWGEGADEKTH